MRARSAAEPRRPARPGEVRDVQTKSHRRPPTRRSVRRGRMMHRPYCRRHGALAIGSTAPRRRRDDRPADERTRCSIDDANGRPCRYIWWTEPTSSSATTSRCPSTSARTAWTSEPTRGVVGSIVQLMEEGATHVGVATDHVIESFRNDLWPGYKTGAGVEPTLIAQFPVVEEALTALGVAVWAEVELEADDALASAAAAANADTTVERVVICTPDKDLAQCVQDPRVVQLDRRHGTVLDRGRRARQVRGPAGLHPRLAGPRRGQRRRVPRPAGLGRQVGQRRARPLRAPRRHPRPRP